MSKATKLSDIPLVTSLESSDTIIATDSAGSVKRIAQQNIHPNTNTVKIMIPESASAGWIRIARFTAAEGVLLTIHHAWYSKAPIPSILMLALCDSHFYANRDSKVIVLSVGNYATKLRVVYPEGGNTITESFLEMYVPDVSNKVFNIRIANNYSTALIKSYQAGSIPSGFVAKEFDITKTAWGGVKRFASTSYKSMPATVQKGAPHEQGCDNPRLGEGSFLRLLFGRPLGDSLRRGGQSYEAHSNRAQQSSDDDRWTICLRLQRGYHTGIIRASRIDTSVERTSRNINDSRDARSVLPWRIHRTDLSACHITRRDNGCKDSVLRNLEPLARPAVVFRGKEVVAI